MGRIIQLKRKKTLTASGTLIKARSMNVNQFYTKTRVLQLQTKFYLFFSNKRPVNIIFFILFH